jgi:hypothetical protein
MVNTASIAMISSMLFPLGTAIFIDFCARGHAGEWFRSGKPSFALASCHFSRPWGDDLSSLKHRLP